MRWLSLIDLAGAMACGVYAGMVLGQGHAPWLAGLASIVLLIALAWPFWAEFRALRTGFEGIERRELEKSRIRREGPPKQEVLTTAAEPALGERRRRPARVTAVVLTLAGYGLLLADVALFVSALPPAGSDPAKITNF